jgi:23S rRNA pseudouridine2605 synthase
MSSPPRKRTSTGKPATGKPSRRFDPRPGAVPRQTKPVPAAGAVSGEGGPREGAPQEGERLQKVLAAAGVGSRRACEELIAAGRVSVDGEVVRTMGLRVDPGTSVIHVDGSRIVIGDTHVYLMLNKPRGVVSTMSDENGRPCVGDYVAGREKRVYHVGRLDAESEGLLLLTNDGALAHRLTHPSYGVEKTYLAEVPGPVRHDVRKRLMAGVELEDGLAKIDQFRVVDNLPGKVLVEVVLHEGRKHIVRRLLEEVGHPVSRLVRTHMGPLQLGSLKPGGLRRLSQQEISALYTDVGL